MRKLLCLNIIIIKRHVPFMRNRSSMVSFSKSNVKPRSISALTLGVSNLARTSRGSTACVKFPDIYIAYLNKPIVSA